MKINSDKINYKVLTVESEGLNDREVQFTISASVVDRDGDLLHADGCDFTNYAKNPVFLPFHNYHDYPLGKVTKYWIEGDKVKAIVYFPTLEELSSDPKYASEKAKLVDFTYYCYKNKMLNAVSVGFRPLEWTESNTGFDITKWELLEFSAVAVPANQDAIADAVKDYHVDLKDILGEVKSGKRISAKTRETLDKIKACGDELKECQKALKACQSKLEGLLKELDDDNDDEEDKPEPPSTAGDNGKEINLADIEYKDEFDLSEIK